MCDDKNLYHFRQHEHSMHANKAASTHLPLAVMRTCTVFLITEILSKHRKRVVESGIKRRTTAECGPDQLSSNINFGECYNLEWNPRESCDIMVYSEYILANPADFLKTYCRSPPSFYYTRISLMSAWVLWSWTILVVSRDDSRG